VPLLRPCLGYQPTFKPRTEQVGLSGSSYEISHRFRDKGRDEPAAGAHGRAYRDSLDRKPDEQPGQYAARMRLLQEYLNHSEHTYGLVTNGLQLRLLRDSVRLSRPAYVEFDLERILDEERYPDFAAAVPRYCTPAACPAAARRCARAALIERYHTSRGWPHGERIRDDLSRQPWSRPSSGFRQWFPAPTRDNAALREALAEWTSTPWADGFYDELLRLIYRLLFLMVIEERHLVYPEGWHRDEQMRRLADIYFKGYSLQRLRQLVRERHRVLGNKDDLWTQLRHTFRIFEDERRAKALGLHALGGELFSPVALAHIGSLHLRNSALLNCLLHLTEFDRKDTKTRQQVNYAGLNVEEFGSVYEGLLDLEPVIGTATGKPAFSFKQGDERSNTGSHYTPDELVQPLIKHSLDHLIAERLREPQRFVTNAAAADLVGRTRSVDPTRVDLPKLQERALLGLRVADISCGSGHILLAAARRIATELAIVRTGMEQPRAADFRVAMRDVIRHCIYGVDLNPLAVELCKVALWLEAHIPGEPLNFLDHRIKCGNAIVGFARREELDRGVPEEAFATLPGDDKEVAAAFRKRNKQERARRAEGLDRSQERESRCLGRGTPLLPLVPGVSGSVRG
jgi:hypothetical protein